MSRSDWNPIVEKRGSLYVAGAVRKSGGFDVKRMDGPTSKFGFIALRKAMSFSKKLNEADR